MNGGNVLEHNRQLIEEAIDKLDFKVNKIARALKTNRTMTIGVLIPNLENIFCTSIISNIESILLEEGYSTIVCDYKEDPRLEKEKLSFLIDKMVDGIIMMPLAWDGSELEELKAKNIPVVLLDRLIKDVVCDAILVDNLNASYNAVEQLIIRGHKRIGIIIGPKNIYTAQERLKGYLRVHEDYHMEIDPQLIRYGDYYLESGYIQMNELLKIDPPITAVYVTNYEMTLGAIVAINESNVNIPNELSFIGFDNLELARIVKPALSVVVQPMKQIAETIATVLLQRLSGDLSVFPLMHRLKTEVIIKDSIAKLV